MAAGVALPVAVPDEAVREAARRHCARLGGTRTGDSCGNCVDAVTEPLAVAAGLIVAAHLRLVAGHTAGATRAVLLCEAGRLEAAYRGEPATGWPRHTGDCPRVGRPAAWLDYGGQLTARCPACYVITYWTDPANPHTGTDSERA